MKESHGSILLVDDARESLELLSGILTGEGFHVRAADSGLLALAAVEAARPDLIMLDMKMPGMGGLALLRRLKAHAQTARIPVIFISGETGTTELVEGLRRGAVDFVTKPFQRDELLARIRTHLELSRLRFHLEKQVEKRTNELGEYQDRLRALSASLISAQEEERRRISRELHDDLVQRLAMIAIDLGLVTAAARDCGLDSSFAAKLTGIQRRAVETAELTRHIAHELHPLILEELGIVAAASTLCEEHGIREGICIDFQSADLPATLNRELSACIYAITKEALANITKHAHAKRVHVSLIGNSRGIVLTIVDDGVGFSTSRLEAVAGLGIMNMRERVRWAGGTFSVTSSPQQGTRIVVDMPGAEGNLKVRRRSAG
jgi:signal transduction histidine kinase